MSSSEPPLQSRKFLAYLVAEVTWKIALIVLLCLGIKHEAIDLTVGSIALAIVVVAGFMEVVYVGGQAALDRYTQIANIAVRGGQGVSLKDVEIKAQAPDVKKD